jgi:hypothetical protein
MKDERRVCTVEWPLSDSVLVGSLGLSPTFEIVNNGIPSTSGNYPNDLIVAIVDLLMFGISRDEREVSWAKLLSLGAVRSADNRAVPACGIYDCI